MKYKKDATRFLPIMLVRRCMMGKKGIKGSSPFCRRKAVKVCATNEGVQGYHSYFCINYNISG